LSTIYFHDCGHSLSSFPNEPGKRLFPTQIREYHHILGYERLKNEEWLKFLQTNGLKWANWEDYLEITATIGLYHRKKMPLSKNESCYYCKGNETWYNPLEERFLKFEGKEFSSDRALFLAALFRIIDSLDNQESRAGSIEDVEFKALILKAEAESEKLKAKSIGELLSKEDKEKADRILERITGNYRGKESEGKSSQEEIDIEKEINDNFCDASIKKIVRLYLEAKSIAFFKEEQPKHYIKHLILEPPLVKYTKGNNGKHKLEIELKTINEEIIKKYKGKLEELCMWQEPEKGKIFKGIEEEYKKVEEILQNGNLIIEYKF
jgi:hypothetical protein